MTFPGDFEMKDWQKTFFNKMTQIINNGGRIILRPRCDGKKMSDKYFLNPDHTYRPCSLMEWAEQFEEIERSVAKSEINDNHISTVWLGLDHNYFGGSPLVFETMVFDKDGKDIYMDRYTTWQEAEEGHKKAIQWVKDGCKKETE